MQWITRKHPKIDRMACCGQISPFIDETQSSSSTTRSTPIVRKTPLSKTRRLLYRVVS